MTVNVAGTEERMKRFFQPVEKDGSSKKKPSLSLSTEDGETTETSGDEKKEPLKFITWNANSFFLRVKNNLPDLAKLITSFDPDVIAIQVPFLYLRTTC